MSISLLKKETVPIFVYLDGQLAVLPVGLIYWSAENLSMPGCQGLISPLDLCWERTHSRGGHLKCHLGNTLARLRNVASGEGRETGDITCQGTLLPLILSCF